MEGVESYHIEFEDGGLPFLKLVWGVLENDLVLSAGMCLLPSCLKDKIYLDYLKHIRVYQGLIWHWHVSPYPWIDTFQIDLQACFRFKAELSAPITEDISTCNMNIKNCHIWNGSSFFPEAPFVGFIFKFCCIMVSSDYTYTWIYLPYSL